MTRPDDRAERLTSKQYREQAQAIIAALEPEERTAANLAFREIAGRVWTDAEIVGIASHARTSGYPFLRSAKATAAWVGMQQAGQETAE